jgi:hypothetical protein
MARCGSIKANGERCKLDATGKHGLCWAHDPENAETRQRRASKGGKAKANREVQALRLQLQELARNVIAGELETGRGAVANQLITTQIKLLEYERKAKDLDELVERLERLERGRVAG